MEVTLFLQPVSAPCPACTAPMTRLETRIGLVAGCVRCGGVWVDHVFGRLVLEGRVSDPMKGFFRHVAEHATGVPAADYRTAGRRAERTCPDCSAALTPRAFGPRGIVLDLCGAHGTFFDLREIDAIIFDVEMRAAVAQVEGERRAELRAQQREQTVFDALLAAAR
jgi:Zn-finger nucleic acid-binding protein